MTTGRTPFAGDAGEPPPSPTGPTEAETSGDAAALTARTRERGLRFAKRMYGPRTLGLGLGFLCVATVLHQNHAHPLAWAALAANGFLWPHLAYFLAARSADPYRTEIRSLLADSAAGGVWVALMAFNLLPSVLLVAMLAMDKISAGGARLLARGAALQVAACAVTVLVFGLDFQPTTTMLNVLGSLPLLVGYPITVGVTTYRLSRKVQDQNRLLAELSRTDGLTGLLNRSHWEQAVAGEFKRHLRSTNAVSLLMVDIDHFKSINDRYGHPVGDEVIRNVAALLRETLREQDTAGRYGGEEFGVVLPDTSLDGANVIAERIRRRVESATVESTTGLCCTVSIGVAEATADVPDPQEWIARADRALYRAKALGRNRTVRHGAAAVEVLTLLDGATTDAASAEHEPHPQRTAPS